MVILTTLSDGIMTNPAFVDMNDFNPYWPMPIGRSPSFTIVGTTMPNMTMCSSDTCTQKEVCYTAKATLLKDGQKYQDFSKSIQITKYIIDCHRYIPIIPSIPQTN